MRPGDTLSSPCDGRVRPLKMAHAQTSTHEQPTTRVAPELVKRLEGSVAAPRIGSIGAVMARRTTIDALRLAPSSQAPAAQSGV